jgi:hypothetical protein
MNRPLRRLRRVGDTLMNLLKPITVLYGHEVKGW